MPEGDRVEQRGEGREAVHGLGGVVAEEVALVAPAPAPGRPPAHDGRAGVEGTSAGPDGGGAGARAGAPDVPAESSPSVSWG